MSDFPTELVDGYCKFRSGDFQRDKGRYEDLAESGQKPGVMVISCCDSRAAPETIFNTLPGELFVVRNVANLVQPYNPQEAYNSVSAALEFAVQALKVQHILVMGHARCGGIAASLNADMEPLSDGNFIGKWIAQLGPLAETVSADETLTASARQTALEQLSIRNSVQNLRTYPWVSDLEEQAELSLHGAWFDIFNGELWTMNESDGQFSPAA